MLAGLLAFIPWIKQWHNEPSEDYARLRLGDRFESFLDGECRPLGLTLATLRAFRPGAKNRGKTARKRKKAPDEGVEAAASDD